jgi:hypothetical protein
VKPYLDDVSNTTEVRQSLSKRRADKLRFISVYGNLIGVAREAELINQPLYQKLVRELTLALGPNAQVVSVSLPDDPGQSVDVVVETSVASTIKGGVIKPLPADAKYDDISDASDSHASSKYYLSSFFFWLIS